MENFSDLQNVCLQVFESVAKTISIFILPLFLTKVVFSNITGNGSEALTVLKSTVIYFCLIAGFPLIMDILFSIPESFLPKIQNASSFLSNSPGSEGSEPSMLPYTLDRIIEAISALAYWIVYYLHIFFMLIMCSMAPVVFLTSTLLGLGIGIEIFLGLLIVGSSWPIIWYGFDQVHLALTTTQSDAFGSRCLELILTIFKGAAPVAFASMAIKSPAGRAISSAAKPAMSTGGGALKMVSSASKNFMKERAQSTSDRKDRLKTYSYRSHKANSRLKTGAST